MEDQQATVEYTAQATSPHVNGEVKLKLEKNGLLVNSLFDVIEIPYADMNLLDFADYNVVIQADSGNYTFSKMGTWCEPFYNDLCEAYNKAVMRAFFVKDEALKTSLAIYNYTEGEVSASGTAMVEVHDDCVVVLPPDLGARRIPLCFASALDHGDYDMTIRLNTAESYSFSKMGYDHDGIISSASQQIRTLYEQALATTKDLDKSLTPVQASQIAKLIPKGAGAPMGKFAAISPSFVNAIEEKISKTRAADSYQIFKQACEPGQIWVGFKKNDLKEDDGSDFLASANALFAEQGIPNPLEKLTGIPDGGSVQDGEGSEAPSDPYLFWMIAPSPDGQYAAVEFAVPPGESAATFVYHTQGDFDAFATQLNRALEAIDFRREVIRLTDEELRNPENADYYMAAKRTSSLKFVRANFEARLIHRSVDGWKKSLEQYFGPIDAAPAQGASGVFCTACGKPNPVGKKFCGECGEKLPG